MFQLMNTRLREAFFCCICALISVLLVFFPVAVHAAVTQFTGGMTFSGTPPFDLVAAPGNDVSATNNIVRTFDKVSYRLGYSLTPSDTGGVITVQIGAMTLPVNYVGLPLTQIATFLLADVPTGLGGCQNISLLPLTALDIAAGLSSGISTDAQTLVCVQPSPSGSATFDIAMQISGAAPNGATLNPPTVTYKSATNPATSVLTVNNDGIATFGLPILTVSAAPRWNLAKQNFTGAYFVPGSGPLGEDGFVFAWNLGVFAQGSRKGLEAISGAYTIGENFNDINFPNSKFVTWKMLSPSINADFSLTGQNGCGDWQNQFPVVADVIDNGLYFPRDTGNVPASTGAFSVPYQVARGGTCDQTAFDNVAKTATLSLNNTDFSLNFYPQTKGYSGGAVTLVNAANFDDPANQWWVASKSVLVWAPLTDLPNPPTPNQKTLLNKVTLSATSVTGQVNVEPTLLDNQSSSLAIAQVAGTFSKNHTAYAYTYPNPMLLDPAPPDPSISGDALVNQMGPGQLVTVRMIVRNGGTLPLAAGYFCDRLDNTRFTFFDATNPAYSAWSKDTLTGIVSFTFAGVNTPLTWRLGVGGTGVAANGTWASYNTVTNEYLNPSVVGSTQSDSACGDPAKGEPNDGITWYPSVAAVLAAQGPTGLQKVTRVRADYASLPAGTTVFGVYPQQANATYTFSGIDNAPGTAFVAGTSTIGAMVPNQAMWQSNTTAIGIAKDADAVKITSNEYIQISKTSSTHPIANGLVPIGSVVGYNLTVNATSTANAHITNVDVWDVIPNYLTYVAGSSTFGGAVIPDPVCANTGLPLTIFPALVQPLAAGYMACHWVLANQPVVKAATGDVAGNLAVIKFNAVLSTSAPAATQLLNTSFADSTNNVRPRAIYGVNSATPVAAASAGFGCAAFANCSFSDWILTTSATPGLLLSKQVSKSAMSVNDANKSFTYTLNYAAIGVPLNGVRLLDVLPYTGDGRVPASNYVGTLQLTAPLATPVVGGLATMSDPTIEIRYTNNLPANISRDPYAVGQVLTGLGANTISTSNWCTAAQFGLAGCPLNIAAVTAFIALPKLTALVPGQLLAGDTYSLIVPVLAAGNAVGNVYSNSFVGDSPSLIARLPGSNLVTTTVLTPDLTVTKTIIGACVGVACVPSTYVPGTLIPPNAKIRYQLTYSNSSYVSAKTNVLLSDVLPSQTAAASVSNVVIVNGAIIAPTAATLAALAAGGATLSFPPLASLLARATGTITLDVQTNAAAGVTVINTAKLVSTEDPVGVSAVASVDVTNLLLSKTTTTAKTLQNGLASYTISIKNAGTVAVDSLQVYDFLPFSGATLNVANQFVYVANSSVYTGGLPVATLAVLSTPPVFLPYSGNTNQQQVAWNFGVFSLAAGATATITFNASVGTTMPFGLYPNSALVNYKVAGVAKSTAIDGAATVEVVVAPSIKLSKVVSAYSDPVNGTVNPKFLPGGLAEYSVTASNIAGPADAIVIEDAVPLNTSLYVKDLGVVGSGPVVFNAGNSGLSYQFLGLANLLDTVEFFNGTVWTAVPIPGADGCDALISKIRVKPTGIFAGSAVAPIPSFNLSFRVCLQ